jgi:hypothetical protein
MRQRSIELIEQAKQALKLLACKPCGSPIIPSLVLTVFLNDDHLVPVRH